LPLKTIYLLILLLLLCFGLNVDALAQTLTESDQQKAASEQDVILKRQQQIWREDERLRQERILLEGEKERIPQEKIPTIDTTISEKYLFEIKKITLQGATKLSRHQKYFVTEKYIGTKMGISHIKQLLADIQNLYVHLGYTTTKPYPIADQDLSSGHLVIAVDEGRVAKVIDETGEKSTALFMAFPFLEGKILNIRDIEQGLDQMNRLQSNRVKVNFVPQKKEDGLGTTVQVVNHNKDKNPYYAAIKYNNNTRHPVRLYPHNFDLSRDNLFNLNDTWYLTYSQDNGVNGQNTNSAALSMSLPFGHTLFSYNYSQFEYHTLIKGEFRNFSTTGKTESHGFGLSQNIFRTQQAKTNLSANLNHKDTDSFIEDVANEPGTRTLTVADIGLNQSLQGFLDGIWSFDLRYHRGLRFWGAPKDPDDLTDTEPQHQFEKTTFTGSLYKNFSFFGLPVSYRGTGRAQYSKDSLFSSEQLSIGGQYSVRGFSETILGDIGAILQNECSAPLHNLMLWKPLVDFVRPTGLQFFGGLDIGYARAKGGEKANGGRGEGTMTGAALGLRHYGELMNIEWVYAKPIKAPDFITKNEEEFYWNVTIKLL
jgi:hemolysin activation/secretion protein